jgi:hypothetical protein
MEGLAAAMSPAPRSVGWVVAPTYDLADRVFREIQLIAVQHLRHRVVTMRDSDRRLILRNMAGGISEIRGKSADNPVSLLGEGLDWLIVDEAARLKPMIWQSHLSQRLVDKRGWAMLISTPKGKGWFFELFQRGQQGRDVEYKSWNYPSRTNPCLDPDVIEQERARLPERVFLQEYEAQFIEGSGAVFRNVRECATGEWQEPRRGETYHAGLDLARVEDFTVLVFLNSKKEVVYVDRFNRLDWQFQVNRIKSASERYGNPGIYCDTTGVGEPVYESLRAAGCRVIPYPFTQRSKNDLINNLSLLLEQKQIILPKPSIWPEGIDEIEAFEYSVTENGNVRSGAPTGVHDDTVIATALACWPLRPMKKFIRNTSIKSFLHLYPIPKRFVDF